jgi:molybdate transport system permease protein
VRPTDRALAVGSGIAVFLLVAFVLLPIMAIFLRVPPGDLLAQLRSPIALDALAVSLKASAIAAGLIVVVGTPVAYVLAVRPFPGSSAVLTLLELPLVLPPAVAGIGLFAAFGRFGLLGSPLRALGVSIPFTQVAVVMALAFVAMPFYVRQAVAAFAAVDRELLGASRTLGAGPGATFFRVALPLARPGLSAGAALAWARALGEFGATIMFAGSFQGRTQTLPLAIYGQFSAGRFDTALAMAAFLVAVSAGLLVGIRSVLSSRDREEAGVAWNPPSRPSSVTA